MTKAGQCSIEDIPLVETHPVPFQKLEVLFFKGFYSVCDPPLTIPRRKYQVIMQRRKCVPHSSSLVVRPKVASSRMVAGHKCFSAVRARSRSSLRDCPYCPIPPAGFIVVATRLHLLSKMSDLGRRTHKRFADLADCDAGGFFLQCGLEPFDGLSHGLVAETKCLMMYRNDELLAGNVSHLDI